MLEVESITPYGDFSLLSWPHTPTKRRGQIISEPTACAVPDAVSEHTTHNRGRYMIINYHCGKGMYTTYTEEILQLFFNHVEQKASFLYTQFATVS